MNSHPRKFQSEDAIALIILIAVVSLFFGPLLIQTDKLIASPLSFPPTDIGGQHWGDLTNYANALRQGKVEIWDALTLLGRPRAGDTGTLFLYPFGLLFVVLPPSLAFNVFFAVHYFMAAVFMFLFLRVGYRISSGAAVFAGLAYAFMPKYIAHAALGHVGVVAALAWAPAVLLGLKLAFEGSLLAAALAGFALAVQMPTHIQEPYYLAIIASIFWAWHMLDALWQWKRGKTSNRKRVLWLLGSYGTWLVSFILLAAAVLGPLLEILPYSSRSSFSLMDANFLALPVGSFIQLFRPVDVLYGEEVIFLGILPIFWGGVGVVLSKLSIKWFWAGLTGFALVYMLGTATPLFEWAFRLVPGFSLLRIPTRIWFFGGLAVAILAGFGLEALNVSWENLLNRWRRPLLALLGISFLLAGGVILVRLWSNQFQYWPSMRLGIMLITGMVLTIWLVGGLNGRQVQWAAVALLAIELLPFDRNYIEMIEPETTFLQSRPDLEFVAQQPGVFRTYIRQEAAKVPYSPVYEMGLEVINGFRSFQINHSSILIQDALDCQANSYSPNIPSCLLDVEQATTMRETARKLGNLNVKYIVSDAALDEHYFEKVFEGEHDVYVNSLWEPRFELSVDGEVALIERAAGYYRFRVDASGDGRLIVRDSWLSSWKAIVDDQTRETELVEGAFIGIAIPAGTHEVVLNYDSSGWRIGATISFLSSAGLLLWVVVAWWRDRRRKS